jgi:anti-anti-sigma factor
MLLSLSSRFCGNVYVVRCQGRLIAGEESKALEAKLDLGAREFSRMVIDVSELDRLDSTGLGLLVLFAGKLRRSGGDLRLAAPQAFVLNLLKLTKLTSVLPVHLSEEEAILSFLQQRSAQRAPEKSGPRVLVLEKQSDLCAFVIAVLTKQGFNVASTSSFRDARILLQVDAADYVLVGSGTPHHSAEAMVESLRALAPKSATLQLCADFHRLDAHQATQELLQMFGVDTAS